MGIFTWVFASSESGRRRLPGFLRGIILHPGRMVRCVIHINNRLRPHLLLFISIGFGIKPPHQSAGPSSASHLAHPPDNRPNPRRLLLCYAVQATSTVQLDPHQPPYQLTTAVLCMCGVAGTAHGGRSGVVVMAGPTRPPPPPPLDPMERLRAPPASTTPSASPPQQPRR